MHADLTPRILAGDDLAAWMVPDPAIPSNHPRHEESYRFPHAVVAGSWAWAITRASHLSRREQVGWVPQAPKCFAYSASGRRLLDIYNPWAGLSSWVPMARYRTWRWHTARIRSVWIHGSPRIDLRQALENGHRLTVGFTTADGVFNRHPVALADITDDGFSLTCEPIAYPALLRNADHLDRLWQDHPTYADGLQMDNAFISGEDAPFDAQWILTDDGRCSTGSEQGSWTTMTVWTDDHDAP